MEYVFLGDSGVQVSRIGLGTAQFGMAPLEKNAASLIHAAIDLGINYIDTSDDYGNRPGWGRPGAPPADQRKSAEAILGKSLKGRRHEVIIATKVTPRYGSVIVNGKPDKNGLDRIHIVRQVEDSLRQLQTDYIDVYNAHHHDFHTPIETTIRAFENLIQQGKIRYYTLGGYPAWHFVEAVMTAARLNLSGPVAHQVPYTITNRSIERDVVPAALRFGVDLTTYAPLGGGYLAGLDAINRPVAGRQRYWGAGVPAFTPGQISAATKMDAFGKEWGYAPAKIAIAWVLSRPAVANVVLAAETRKELEENIDAIEITLSDGQLDILEQVGDVPAMAAPPRSV